MAERFQNNLSYHIRTALGFSVILLGLLGGLWVGWWLSFHGDIVEILRQLKMGLPPWGWMLLKYGLTLAFVAFIMLAFIGLGFIILRAGGRAKRRPSE